MIQINLLPEELRRATRTSTKALALLFGATVLCFGGLGTTGFLWFNVRADKQARVDIAQEQLDNIVPGARYADQLAKEKSEFETRNKTIGEIAASRIVWTRKLDRLAEIVSRDATQRSHRVWLDSIDVDNRADSSKGGIEFKGCSAGPDIDGVSNFHDELSHDPVFSEGFKTFTPHQSKLGDTDDSFDPPVKREFEFAVKLPVKEKKTAPKKKPAAAKPSGS